MVRSLRLPSFLFATGRSEDSLKEILGFGEALWLRLQRERRYSIPVIRSIWLVNYPYWGLLTSSSSILLAHKSRVGCDNPQADKKQEIDRRPLGYFSSWILTLLQAKTWSLVGNNKAWIIERWIHYIISWRVSVDWLLMVFYYWSSMFYIIYILSMAERDTITYSLVNELVNRILCQWLLQILNGGIGIWSNCIRFWKRKSN